MSVTHDTPVAEAQRKEPRLRVLLRRNFPARLRTWRRPRSAGPPAAKRNPTAVLRQWHQRAGLAACAFLIWLALSGILLTRSADLGFDAARVDWNWLMSIYGLHAEPPRNGWRTGAHWLAQTQNYTVLDGKPLPTAIAGPLGLVATGDTIYVAASDSLVLLSPSGERLDELRPPILPVSTIRRAGAVLGHDERVAVQDLDAYQSADGGNTWTPVASTEVRWSQPAALSETERGTLLPYSRPSVIVEQVLIDLHSGRLFGPIGAWTITLIGCIALWLAGSGVTTWWRVSRAKKRREAPVRQAASAKLADPL